MLSFIKYSGRRLRDAYARWLMSYRVEQGREDVRFYHPIAWLNDDPRAITLGRHVSIGPFSDIAVQASHPSTRIPGELRVGTCTAIGALCNIRASGGAIRIGDNCMLGQNVSLIAANHLVKPGCIYWQLPWDETKTGVTIGNNVWLGCGVTVLPGCTVGDNAVVAAGSVVTKSIPAGTVWAGNPALQVGAIE